MVLSLTGDGDQAGVTARSADACGHGDDHDFAVVANRLPVIRPSMCFRGPGDHGVGRHCPPKTAAVQEHHPRRAEPIRATACPGKLSLSDMAHRIEIVNRECHRLTRSRPAHQE